jgi:SAM-dependent methyltransferase
VLIHEQAAVPVHSTRLVADRSAALAFPRGDLRLHWCRRCDFITNQAFDPTLVDYTVEGYEDSQMGSPTFRAFACDLADHLVDRYGLRGGCVLEVGSGQGEFLHLIAERGDLIGIGVDPASPPRRPTGGPPVHLRQERLAPEHAMLPFDLICCRHTLEHIPDVASFLRLLRTVAVSGRRPVYVEVPDTERILREGAFWDLYYEHCSYFSAGSLRALFEREGFTVVDLRRGYGDQYLLCEAIPEPVAARRTPDTVPDLAEAVVALLRTASQAQDRLRRVFEEVGQAGGRAVLWGAGSKAVALLASVTEASIVEHVVDLDPRKHGRFLPGSGCEVVAPSRLPALGPALVVVMNPLYEDEIRRDLAGLGVTCPVIAC